MTVQPSVASFFWASFDNTLRVHLQPISFYLIGSFLRTSAVSSADCHLESPIGVTESQVHYKCSWVPPMILVSSSCPGNSSFFAVFQVKGPLLFVLPMIGIFRSSIVPC